MPDMTEADASAANLEEGPSDADHAADRAFELEDESRPLADDGGPPVGEGGGEGESEGEGGQEQEGHRMTARQMMEQQLAIEFHQDPMFHARRHMEAGEYLQEHEDRLDHIGHVIWGLVVLAIIVLGVGIIALVWSGKNGRDIANVSKAVESVSKGIKASDEFLGITLDRDGQKTFAKDGFLLDLSADTRDNAKAIGQTDELLGVTFSTSTGEKSLEPGGRMAQLDAIWKGSRADFDGNGQEEDLTDAVKGLGRTLYGSPSSDGGFTPGLLNSDLNNDGSPDDLVKVVTGLVAEKAARDKAAKKAAEEAKKAATAAGKQVAALERQIAAMERNKAAVSAVEELGKTMKTVDEKVSAESQKTDEAREALRRIADAPSGAFRHSVPRKTKREIQDLLNEVFPVVSMDTVDSAPLASSPKEERATAAAMQPVDDKPAKPAKK